MESRCLVWLWTALYLRQIQVSWDVMKRSCLKEIGRLAPPDILMTLITKSGVPALDVPASSDEQSFSFIFTSMESPSLWTTFV